MKEIGQKVKYQLSRFFLFLFIGSGWQAFLLRLVLILISFALNPLGAASHSFVTGPMKLWLLTCFFLLYAIIKLIKDYSPKGRANKTID